MRFQFYFFGLAYLLKCACYAIEINIWNEVNWFYVLLLNSVLLILCDVIPIVYIACVHNHTFKEMQYNKLQAEL